MLLRSGAWAGLARILPMNERSGFAETRWSMFVFSLKEQYYARLAVLTAGQGSSLAGRIVLRSWLVFNFFFLKPQIAGVESWRMPQILFPQIRFNRPRLSDFFRLIVQSLWLLLFKQKGEREVTPTSKPHESAYLLGTKQRWRNFRQRIEVSAPVLGLRKWVREQERIDFNAKQELEDPSLLRRLTSGVGRSIIIIAMVCLAFISFTVPLDVEDQFIFITLLFLAAYALNKIPGQLSMMLMVGISLLATGRYVWWRCTSTLNWDDTAGLIFGIGLILAEAYAWTVLLLGYTQNIRPLKRSTVPLPADSSTWPVIDLMVPTYNEDLEVVTSTVYACLGLDWPKDKLRIHILDDGKRDSFRDFAAEVGVNYIRRPTNEHAKAGNINYALAQTSGEYVAIFDCDHIPTRVFFQISMGWFLKDPKLALIQTPHHFFSPDPFERNLTNFRKVPNEGGLFYGLIQDGNDLWNSAFFCGSCAIMRRAPLMEVGGIAVETVTEDAHTSLRMHRHGYSSAYLRAPLSAGLATETLSAHVGQRIRWARGMAQIFRTDNPLFGSGLSFGQRLCYLTAMMHFLGGVPRLVFLTAPLMFLIFHTYIIYAPALVLVLYVVPHVLHSSMTNSRMQGKFRYSFWGEVYEVVLSWYIARPTTVALFAPNKGSFNVTAKGGLIESEYYDWVISKPYMLLVLANFIGVGFGFYRYFFGPANEIGAVAVNMLWTLYNVMIIGSAIAVASEMKQVRKTHRVDTDIPAILSLDTGHLLQARVVDFSMNGLRLKVADGSNLPEGNYDVEVVLNRANREYSFPMRMVYNANSTVGLNLKPLDTETMTDYVQCTFARADTWVKWQDEFEVDRPLSSMASVFRASIYGYRRMLMLSPKPLPQITEWLIGRFLRLASFLPKAINSRVDYS
jgi:cellulose synthase (UDP-forming)